MNKNLENLVKISKRIGENQCYVQGGGGNTSVKLDERRMAIKASGISLCEMTLENGYSIVDYPKICNYINFPDEDEKVFNNKIKSYVTETENIPSIETGFHALLKKYVIHTHSVYANLLSCSTGGETIVQKLFRDSLWLPYATPGRELTLNIFNSLKNLIDSPPEIIFLKNHGLIITSDCPDRVLEINEAVNNKIKDYFEYIIDFQKFDNNKKIENNLDFMKENVLFPDQVVYLENKECHKTAAAAETNNAYWFIIYILEKNGLTPCFIPEYKADIIKQMESEKYRQRLIKNDKHCLCKPSD